jgi:GNAT superfamily N-acetyltransferase
MDTESARQIVGWRYPPPYDVYNMVPEDVDATVRDLTDPRYAYYALRDGRQELVAFCCYGADARVPGGEYAQDALDVGMGVRPDRTGRGQGHLYARAVLDFAERNYDPRAYRVTIAAFNLRALCVWLKLGFYVVEQFERESDGAPFQVLFRAR